MRARGVIERMGDVHVRVPRRGRSPRREAPIGPDLAKLVVVVELADGRQLPAPFVGEEEPDVVEVEAHRREELLRGPEQATEGASGTRVDVDVDGREAER